MDRVDYECPDCGDPGVVLAPGIDGEMLAACEGCGRDHGRWADCLASLPSRSPKAVIPRSAEG